MSDSDEEDGDVDFRKKKPTSKSGNGKGKKAKKKTKAPKRRQYKRKKRNDGGGDDEAIESNGSDMEKEEDDDDDLESMDTSRDNGEDGSEDNGGQSEPQIHQPPSTIYFFDQLEEEKLNVSNLYRLTVKQNLFGNQLRQLETTEEPIRDKDPLARCRLPPNLLLTNSLYNLASSVPLAKAVDVFGYCLKRLAHLSKIPVDKIDSQLDYRHSLAVVIDCLIQYRDRPLLSSQQRQLAQPLSWVTQKIWQFYFTKRPSAFGILTNGVTVGNSWLPAAVGSAASSGAANRQKGGGEEEGEKKGFEEGKQRFRWWQVIQTIHTAATNLLVDIHLPLISVYREWTVGRFLKEINVATSNREWIWRKNKYTHRAFLNGLVGCAYDGIEKGEEGEETSRTHSNGIIYPPDSICEPFETASRSNSAKTPLPSIYKRNTYVNQSRFCNLTLSMLIYLATELQAAERSVLWNQESQFFLLLLWKRFCLLSTCPNDHQEALDIKLHTKKRRHSGFLKLTKRFIYSMEILFVRLLQKFRLLHQLQQRAIDSSRRLNKQRERGEGGEEEVISALPTNFPQGFIDIFEEPHRQSFLPPVQLQTELDLLITESFLQYAIETSGITTVTVISQYYRLFPSWALLSGSYDTQAFKDSDSSLNPENVIAELYPSQILPIARTTFERGSILRTLNVLRGPDFFPSYVQDQQLVPYALNSHACYIASILQTHPFAYTKVNTASSSSDRELTQHERLVLTHLLSHPELSLPGPEHYSHSMRKTANAFYTLHRDAETNALTGSEAPLRTPTTKTTTTTTTTTSTTKPPIEQIHSPSWFITGMDALGLIPLSPDNPVFKPKKANEIRTWPLFVFDGSEFWVVGTNQWDFVFRTYDEWEAKTAWFTKFIQEFGSELQLTSVLLDKFEHSLGEKLRKLFTKI